MKQQSKFNQIVFMIGFFMVSLFTSGLFLHLNNLPKDLVTGFDIVCLILGIFGSMELLFWSNIFEYLYENFRTKIGATIFCKLMSLGITIISVIAFNLIIQIMDYIKHYLLQLVIYLGILTGIVGVFVLFIWLNSLRIDEDKLKKDRPTNEKSCFEKLKDWFVEEIEDEEDSDRSCYDRLKEDVKKRHVKTGVMKFCDNCKDETKDPEFTKKTNEALDFFDKR